MAGVIKTVGVVGTGVIGGSWTALFLSQGLKVIVSDPGPDAEKKLSEYLRKVWPSLQQLGLADGASLDNYTFVGPSMEHHYGEVDFIQENAPEKLDLKMKLFGEIDAAARPDVIIASSSSGITSSQFIGQCKKQPERVLIGHPFNPPHLMPLVEVVPHPGTSPKAVETALDVYKGLGKRPVLIKKEVPGFATNRLQAALNAEAYSLVQRGVLSATDVDACITTSIGPRWALTGPYMTGALGGGGGSDGFTHMMQHLGPAAESWLKDMQAHQYTFTADNLSVLSKSVAEEMEEFDPVIVEHQRDELLIQLLNSKKTASAIV